MPTALQDLATISSAVFQSLQPERGDGLPGAQPGAVGQRVDPVAALGAAQLVLEDVDGLVRVVAPALAVHRRLVEVLPLGARRQHQAGLGRVGVVRHGRAGDGRVVDRVGDGQPDLRLVQALDGRVDLQQRQVAREVVRLVLEPGPDGRALLPHLPDLGGEGLGRVELAALQLEVGGVVVLEDRVVDRRHRRGAEERLAPVGVGADQVDLGLVVALQREGPAAHRLEVLLLDHLGAEGLPDVLGHDEGARDRVLDRARVVRVALDGELDRPRVHRLDRRPGTPTGWSSRGRSSSPARRCRRRRRRSARCRRSTVVPSCSGSTSEVSSGSCISLARPGCSEPSSRLKRSRRLVDQLGVTRRRRPGRRRAERVEVGRDARLHEDEERVAGRARAGRWPRRCRRCCCGSARCRSRWRPGRATAAARPAPRDPEDARRVGPQSGPRSASAGRPWSLVHGDIPSTVVHGGVRRTRNPASVASLHGSSGLIGLSTSSQIAISPVRNDAGGRPTAACRRTGRREPRRSPRAHVPATRPRAASAPSSSAGPQTYPGWAASWSAASSRTPVAGPGRRRGREPGRRRAVGPQEPRRRRTRPSTPTPARTRTGGRPRPGEPFPDGSFGENLTTAGLDLTNAAIGQTWHVGTAVLQVTEPRTPCWKLGLKMGDPAFPRQAAASRRPGRAAPGAAGRRAGGRRRVVLGPAPAHGVTAAGVNRVYYGDDQDLSPIWDAPELAAHWRTWAGHRTVWHEADAKLGRLGPDHRGGAEPDAPGSGQQELRRVRGAAAPGRAGPGPARRRPRPGRPAGRRPPARPC